jgi:hypothetical protein
MMNLNSKSNEQEQGIEEYEEITEKRTSRLGSIVLIILALFLLVIGQKVFSDVKDIPEEPIHPAYCTPTYSDINLLKDCNFARTCHFTETDRKFNVEQNFRKVEPQIKNIILLNQEISQINIQINSSERELDKLLGRYGVGLQEIMIGDEPFIDKPAAKATISSLNNEISLLNKELDVKTKERNSKLNIIKPKLLVLENSYEQAMDYYKTKAAWFNFIVFLLKLAFVLPLFGLSLYYYFKLKKGDHRDEIYYLLRHGFIGCGNFWRHCVLYPEESI